MTRSKSDTAQRLTPAPATDGYAIHHTLDATADLAAFRRDLDRGFDVLLGGGGFADRFAR